MVKTDSVWQIQSAKNRFCELVKRAAAGEPQLVTRHGTEVAYIVSVELFNERLGGSQRSKVDVLLNSPHKDTRLQTARQRDAGREVEL